MAWPMLMHIPTTGQNTPRSKASKISQNARSSSRGVPRSDTGTFTVHENTLRLDDHHPHTRVHCYHRRHVPNPLARLEPEAGYPPLRFKLALEPERVIASLLADPRVAEARLSSLGTLHGPSARFVLERTGCGFILAARASEPGIWEPGAYTVLEGRIRPCANGSSELVMRFRLHPLTRGAYLMVAAVTLLILPLQAWTTGLLLGTAMLFPIVIAGMVIGLDRRRLGQQRECLQRLVEQVFAPLALAREPRGRTPFRGTWESSPRKAPNI